MERIGDGMSVIVTGMDMPKNCAECERWSICKCLNDYGDYESILDAVEDGDLVKADGCPLVDIPTPHGRLIDADKLEKGFKRAIGTYLPKDPTRHMNIADGSECRGWTQALTAVQEAKTVIEAEDVM